MIAYLYILEKCDLSAVRSITLSAYCDGIPEALESNPIHFGIPRLDLGERLAFNFRLISNLCTSKYSRKEGTVSYLKMNTRR